MEAAVLSCSFCMISQVWSKCNAVTYQQYGLKKNVLKSEFFWF